MPLHDWSLVHPGEYHAFHNLWIGELQKSLNRGLLPSGFYALNEQQHIQVDTGDEAAEEEEDNITYRPDLLALREDDADVGGVATAPRMALKAASGEADFYAVRRRTLAIRHITGDRPVAMVEIASPGNKDGGKAVGRFVDKCLRLLRARLHLVVIDPLPPRLHDPRGLAVEVAEAASIRFGPGSEGLRIPGVSFEAGLEMKAYADPFDLGDDLPPLPLFLRPGRHVELPLTATYAEAFGGSPPKLRERLAAALA